MPLRFAAAHRFFAAMEIRFLPSAVRCRRSELSAVARGFFAGRGDACRFTISFALTTDALARSRNSRRPCPLAAYWQSQWTVMPQLVLTASALSSLSWPLFLQPFSLYHFAKIGAPNECAIAALTSRPQN